MSTRNTFWRVKAAGA